MIRIRTLVSTAVAIVAAGIMALTLAPAATAHASNTYPYGQCTYFAKSQRPDIGNYWGNARHWSSVARANGYSVSSQPRVGDVVVFQAYVQGNSPYGHVGIVTAVDGSRFRVSSMWGNEATGRVHVTWHHTGGGVSFIHRSGSVAKAAPPKAAPPKAAPPKAALPKAAPPKAAPPKTAPAIKASPAKAAPAAKASPVKAAPATKAGPANAKPAAPAKAPAHASPKK